MQNLLCDISPNEIGMINENKLEIYFTRLDSGVFMSFDEQLACSGAPILAITVLSNVIETGKWNPVAHRIYAKGDLK